MNQWVSNVECMWETSHSVWVFVIRTYLLALALLVYVTALIIQLETLWWWIYVMGYCMAGLILWFSVRVGWAPLRVRRDGEVEVGIRIHGIDERQWILHPTPRQVVDGMHAWYERINFRNSGTS